MNTPATRWSLPAKPTAKLAINRSRGPESRVEPLEARIAPATLAGNYNFEELPDFDQWTVNTGPSSALTEYVSVVEVVRGGLAPEGDAYAHLSFEGRAGIGATGFGPSIQSETFTASADDVITVDWRATDGVDTAHPRGRLFTAGGVEVGILFDSDTGTTAFETASFTVPADGNYYLLFEIGSSDVSVGGLVGASLDIDAIHRVPAGQGVIETPTPGGNVTVSVSGGTAIPNTFLVTLDETGLFAQIFVNGSLNYVQLLSTIDRISIAGGDENDQLTVDSSRGLVAIAEGIHFDGGAGEDTAQLTQTAGTVRTSDTYSVGPTAGEGTSVISGGNTLQTVIFQNVEPVLNNVPSDSFTINATADGDDIRSTDGPGGGVFTGVTGTIAIVGFEPIEFNHKRSLTINGLGGNDAFSLDNALTPEGLLGSILINGGDSAFPYGDTLHYAKVGAILPVAAGVGTITAAGFPAVNFTGMEVTSVDGYTLTRTGSGLDILAEGTALADIITVASNAAAQFLTLDLNGSIGVYADQSAIARIIVDGLGGDDTLALNGTTESDAFTHGATAHDAGTTSIAGMIPVEYSATESVELNGLGGDDTFAIGGAFGTVRVNGGNGTNTLRVTGTNSAETFALNPTSTSAGGISIASGASITYAAIASIVIDAQDGDDTFALNGSIGIVELIGGDGSDRVDFSAAADGVTFDLDATGTDQTVIPAGQTVKLGDVIEHFTGSPFNDTLHADAAAFTRDLNGGDNSNEAFPPGDRLFFDGQGQVVLTNLVDWNTGTYRTTGFADVTFDEFETPLIVNSPSGPGFGSPDGNTAFNAAQIYPVANESPSDTRPKTVVTADLNGDGFADLIVVNPTTARISVLLNLGDGTFGPAASYKTRGLGSNDIAIGNFDASPGLDLAVTNRASSTLAILSGDGNGSFARAKLIKTQSTPSAIATGDLNGDHIDDIVIAHPGIHKISVLLGTGTGIVRSAIFKTAGRQPADVVVGDFNDDGNADIVTANRSSNTISFFKGDGLGSLDTPAQFAVGVRPTAIATGDFNLDGAIDLAVSNRGVEFFSILLSNGSVADTATQFQPQTQIALPGKVALTSIVAADFNGDGHTDLSLGTLFEPTFTVLLGGNFGTFSQPYTFDIGTFPSVPKRGLAVADFNNDGLLDVVSTSRNPLEALVLLRKFQITP